MKPLASIAVLALLVLSFGCGESDKSYRAGKDRGSVPGNAKDAREKSAELPPDFPKDVPILKNATVKVVMSQGNRITVHLSTTSPVAEATNFYDDAFKRQGWTIEGTTKSNEMSILSARKGASHCGVTISKQGNGTLIRLALSQDGSHAAQ